jgi:transcriptional regulator with XRE-family HTH domain
MEQTHSFGYWLRRRRKALDLTQAALAERVSCSIDLIQKIEADTRRPSRQIAEKLAESLGLDADERVAFV